ncbi:phage head closure protein [Pseudooceanicola nitratireducens]|jgi:SPP1 family predicted phage head-tail adaptor|uniref:phage head closure protein n=1 Tax=Pseudooceanicola nitratireducens TaxID=517719 RepID=UPI003C6E2705
MIGAGRLSERVAFDSKTAAADGSGGRVEGWTEEFSCWGQFIYSRGGETEQAARLQGRSVYKLLLRSSSETRRIVADWRMRDLRRGAVYNVREVDAISQRGWVYLVVESGVAE